MAKKCSYAHISGVPQKRTSLSASISVVRPQTRTKPAMLAKAGNAKKGSRRAWPQILPGGKAVLFTESSSPNHELDDIVVQALPDGSPKTVWPGGCQGKYLSSGHLVYVHEGKLFAAPFDLNRLEYTATPVPVIDGVQFNQGWARISFSNNGTMVYQPADGDFTRIPISTIQWLDSSGKTLPIQAEPGRYSDLRCSPDGKRLAVRVLEGGTNGICIWDWERRIWTRLTQNIRWDRSPLWAPDGEHVVFRSDRDDDTSDIYWMRADGTGEAQRIAEHPGTSFPTPGSFSPDGKQLAYSSRGSWASPGRDILILNLDLSDPDHPKPGKPERFSEGEHPAFSPDGHWLAFEGSGLIRGIRGTGYAIPELPASVPR